MGLFKEYVHMVSKGLTNAPNVIQGNFNLLKDSLNLLPQDEQDEADRRYSICKTCPFLSVNAPSYGFYDTQRKEEHCSLCKCPIEAKVMAFNDSCGLNIIAEKKDEHGNYQGGVVGYKVLWDVYKK